MGKVLVCFETGFNAKEDYKGDFDNNEKDIENEKDSKVKGF